MRIFSSSRFIACLAAILLLISTPGLASNMPLPSEQATSSITAADLKKHLSFLASKELGGRYTLSSSNVVAARYLASQLEYYGYQGAAAGASYFQKVPLSFRRVDQAGSSLNIDSEGSHRPFKYGDDFLQETVPSACDASGGLVFVGYGISSPENHHDDYSKLDVSGKIVVEVSGVPESLKGVKIPEGESGGEAAAAHGAKGEIIITPPQFLLIWSQLKNSQGEDQPSLPPKPGKSTVPAFPTVFAGPELIKAIAVLTGKDLAFLQSPGGKEVPAQALEASARIAIKVDLKDAPPAQNVVGVLEGSDPVLRDQYVAFSAHYDHLKTNDAGEIYTGADDDGSGTASVLEIAKAFSISHPRRSILIIFHTGEELGLFGSEYNTDYAPVVPLDKIVADLNIDMVGRSRPDGDQDPRDAHLTDKNSLYIIGADKLSTELNQISEQTDQDTERMRFDYTYNDESNPEKFYYRSDHYNYAKHGIPIIFYFTGVHADYHQPTDTVDKIDFTKMERIDRLIFATGWRVANLDHRLVVDKKQAAH
jgi:hypothetical protein